LRKAATFSTSAPAPIEFVRQPKGSRVSAKHSFLEATKKEHQRLVHAEQSLDRIDRERLRACQGPVFRAIFVRRSSNYGDPLLNIVNLLAQHIDRRVFLLAVGFR
jgi:hypothetical protein